MQEKGKRRTQNNFFYTNAISWNISIYTPLFDTFVQKTIQFLITFDKFKKKSITK
jgi:hypothetical protein